MESASIAELDRKHVFHSWTVNENYQGLEVNRAQGCYFWDSDGKKYFDLSAQLLCVNAGHGQQKILDGIRQQLEKVCYVAPGHVNDVRARLAAKLAEIAPGDLSKVFFTNGGADAIENAVKIARFHTGRHKVLTRYRSFHGATYGAMTLSGDPRHRAHTGTMIPGVIRALDPYCYRCPFSLKYPSCETFCADHVRQVVELEGPETVAAILMEPITGTNGIIIPPGDYWQKIRRLCDEYGILLIVDEVMTGFGRTGSWFGIEQFDVEPDLIACAKGLTSAYAPLGAVLVSKQIADALDKTTLPIGLTYSGHSLSCAAGLAALEFYESENVFENCRARGETFLARLRDLHEKHACVGDARGVGLFGVLELVKDKATREPLVPWNAAGAAGAPAGQIKNWLLEEGLFTFVRWMFIFLSPPLVVTEEELNDALDRLDRVLTRIDEAYL